jgi:hypothetical protein
VGYIVTSLISLWLFLFILLFQLQNRMDGVVRLLPAIVLILSSFALLLFSRRIVDPRLRKENAAYFLFLAVMGGSFVRGWGEVGVVKIVTFFLVLVASALVVSLLARRIGTSFSNRMGFEVFCYPLLGYICVSVVLYVLGFKEEWTKNLLVDYSSGSARMLSAIGVQFARVQFYFSNGVNSFSPVAGMAILMSHAFYKDNKFISVVLICVASVTLMMVDGRGAMLYIAVTLFW